MYRKKKQKQGTAAALSGPDSPDTPIGVGTVTETVTHVGATDAEMPDARPSGIHVGCGNNVAEEFAVHNSNSHLEKIDTQKGVVAEPKPTPVPNSVPCRQAETPRGSKYDDAHQEKSDTQKVVVKPTPVPTSVPCRQAETPSQRKVRLRELAEAQLEAQFGERWTGAGRQ